MDQLHRQLDEAARGGLEDTRADAAAEAPRLTGEYASNFQSTYNPEDGTGAVYNPLPQAGAVERGANVGPRRGPHMAGSHTLRTVGPRWLDHTTRRLRGA